ncbi:MAG: 5-formyltetrahydrofolate cyclo-ligase [Armatimonadota bacterium]|nr:5-formyltetrahydrofolate cyclo-ligase [Armatimonadota bacterium]MDW8155785.1 5-formyltetrahydrofolate cyclo-ligase [Armatimonadota bacterium]
MNGDSQGRRPHGHVPALEVERAKQAVRERVWRLLEERGVARFPGAWGRIPNFVGAEEAARKLVATEEWRRARVVKANPDRPQLPVRARALAEGKLLFMAVPKLVSPTPFVCLDPARVNCSPQQAGSIRGAFRWGRAVAPEEVPHVDLVVCGSVAVNLQGVRVGKGGGYSDLEFGLLAEFGRVDEDTVIATTVHPLQVLDEELPETDHDFRVDLVATPEGVLRTGSRRRPPGILRHHLTPEKVASIPVLRAFWDREV